MDDLQVQTVIAIYILNLWLQAFLSPRRKKNNLTQSSNYLPERTEILTQRSKFIASKGEV